MPGTPQASAISCAQELMAVAQTLDGLKPTIDRIVSVYNSEGINAEWAAMATAAVNADGSLGAADGSPNAAHPITVGNLNVSSTKLISGIVMIEQLQNFLNNVAVTQGNYLQTVRDLATV